MADAGYYEQVQRDLDQYDTVLYEGVKQGDQPNKETIGLQAVQSGMARVLGLQYQKDGIAYVGTNMVHADIDASALERNLNGEKLTPFGGMISPEMVDRLKPFLELLGTFLDQWLASNPGIQNSLKHQFGSSMSQTDVSSQLPPNMKKAIIDDRNQIVMDVLAEQRRVNPHRKRIAIFYGAAHNMDFSRRLQAQGYTRGTRRWLTAWEIGKVEAGGGLFGGFGDLQDGFEGLGGRDELRGPGWAEKQRERRLQEQAEELERERRRLDEERRELERMRRELEREKAGAGK